MMERAFPEHWVETTLGECIDIFDSKRIPLNADERSDIKGSFPYYGATGIVDYISRFIFDEELLLLGEDGAPFLDKGKQIAFIISGKSWVNNHAHVIRANYSACNKFIMYFLNQFDFHDFVNGTTRLKLTQDKMRNIPFPLPPIAEQKRIVEQLDAILPRVKTAKARLERIPGILKKFRQSVLAEACSGKLTEDWRAEQSGNAGEQDEGNVSREDAKDTELPEGWAETTIASVITDLSYGTSQKCEYEVAGGTPVLRIPNVSSGKLDLHDLKYAKLDVKERNKLYLEEGDILVIRSNGSVSLLGLSIVIDKAAIGYAYAGYLIRLRCNRTISDPDYLNHCLKTDALRTQIELPARSTTGVNNINSDELRLLRFPLPPLPEQHEIVRRVEKLFAAADRIEAKYRAAMEKVGKIEQAVLGKAFRGELAEADPNDEPASVLLERLRLERAKEKDGKMGRGRKKRGSARSGE